VVLSPGVSWSGREMHHSSVHGFELRNVWNSISAPPYSFMAWTSTALSLPNFWGGRKYKPIFIVSYYLLELKVMWIMIKMLCIIKGNSDFFSNLDKMEREVKKIWAHYKAESYMMFYDSTRYTKAEYVLDRTARLRRGGKGKWSLICEAYSNIIG